VFVRLLTVVLAFSEARRLQVFAARLVYFLLRDAEICVRLGKGLEVGENWFTARLRSLKQGSTWALAMRIVSNKRSMSPQHHQIVLSAAGATDIHGLTLVYRFHFNTLLCTFSSLGHRTHLPARSVIGPKLDSRAVKLSHLADGRSTRRLRTRATLAKAGCSQYMAFGSRDVPSNNTWQANAPPCLSHSRTPSLVISDP
jgi:hypothetical protein